MRRFVDPRQGRLFDPFDGLIPPLGLERIHNGWQGIFRTALLELMPAHELGKHFSATYGRPTKELYSVAGLLFLQEFQNWICANSVDLSGTNAKTMQHPQAEVFKVCHAVRSP
jgi:hypothetical protein